MFFLISNDEIVGTSDTALVQLPEDWQCVEGMDAPPEMVFFADGEILERPEKPDPSCFWDVEQKVWRSPDPLPIIKTQDWKGLEEDFRGSAIYAKVYFAGKYPEANTIAALTKTQGAAQAGNLLTASLTATHSVDDLMFAISEVRSALTSINSIGDFTAEQMAFINERLIVRGFDFQLD